MIVKEFSTRLNALAKYSLIVIYIDKVKIEAFISDLRSDIANDVVIRNHNPNTYLRL